MVSDMERRVGVRSVFLDDLVLRNIELLWEAVCGGNMTNMLVFFLCSAFCKFACRVSRGRFLEIMWGGSATTAKQQCDDGMGHRRRPTSRAFIAAIRHANVRTLTTKAFRKT